MLFPPSFLAVLTATPIIGAYGGQVPIVAGVHGGVPSTAAVALSTLKSTSTAPVRAGGLRVVENSGVCETTPGVYQASGYGDIASNKSIWFWFFAARNGKANAPVALWFNGGPGSSSMIGLFQEHGPCRITNDTSTVTNNPYSWNNKAHVLYIDQPVGVGFSYGTLDVSTSQQAAVDVWTFLQIFFKDSRFSKYQRNDLAIWTESYGGHYAPRFAAHILRQNAAIASHSLTGVRLNLKILGLGNGLTDPLSQYPGYITYAGHNTYHPLVSSGVVKKANTSWTRSDGCKSQITDCYNGGSDSVCSSAQNYCNINILTPLAGAYDLYYVPARTPDAYPPDFTKYINGIASKVGAQGTWAFSNDAVYDNFAATGDWMKNSRPYLEIIINAGVRTIIYNGDADYILNFYGVEAMVAALNTKFSAQFAKQKFAPYKVDGQTAGQYKNAGTFSYVRIYGAGHEVPAYKYGKLAGGQAASQMFTQIVANQPLSST